MDDFELMLLLFLCCKSLFKCFSVFVGVCVVTSVGVVFNSAFSVVGVFFCILFVMCVSVVFVYKINVFVNGVSFFIFNVGIMFCFRYFFVVRFVFFVSFVNRLFMCLIVFFVFVCIVFGYFLYIFNNLFNLLYCVFVV